MKDILTRVTGVMLHRAEEKGLRLTFTVDEALHPVLLGDPYRLNQILLNLVSNAIKFTEKGTVSIRCYVKDSTQGRQTIGIKVTDTGIGMDALFLQNLFQKFLQEDRSVARKYGGTGLGMSISKQLVELMRGSIEVNSKKYKGTEVILSIPFTQGMEADLPVKEDTIPDATILQKKKILLVEDNEMNRLVATTVLNNYGAEVAEVVNSVEAVEAVKNNRYDLILMDVQMPVMGGLEATRIIREVVDKSIPIIALTANAIKGESSRCIASGMNDYISKPFEEDHLVKMIANWLGKGTTTCLASEKGTVNTPLYSLCKLEKISPGNDAFVKKMLHLFLQEVPGAVQSIHAALNENNLALIQASAHRLKPILVNLDIVSLKEVILNIERMAAERKPSPELNGLVGELVETIQLVIADMRVYLAAS